MTAMPKGWYEERIVSLCDRLDRARELYAADDRALKEAQAAHAESYDLVKELEATIFGLRRELNELEKQEEKCPIQTVTAPSAAT